MHRMDCMHGIILLVDACYFLLKIEARTQKRKKDRKRKGRQYGIRVSMPSTFDLHQHMPSAIAQSLVSTTNLVAKLPYTSSFPLHLSQKLKDEAKQFGLHLGPTVASP